MGTRKFFINTPSETILEDACGGVYELKGITDEYEQIGKKMLKKRLTSVQDPQGHFIVVTDSKGIKEETLSIYIDIKRTKVSDNSSSAQINNVFSFLTLGIWPWMESRTQCYQIGISGEPDMERQEISIECSYKAWSSSILFPIAALPVPGKSTWRSGISLGKESVHIGSFGNNEQEKLQDLYPFSEVENDIGIILLQELSKECNKLYFQNKRNRLYLAKRQQEEEKARIEEERIQKERLHLVLIQKSSLKLRDIKKESKTDQILQEFSIKAEPKIWEILERFRAILCEEDIKILNLKTDLDALGKNAVDDPGYVILCEERYKDFQLYSSLYKKLGDAYLMMESGEKNSWEKGRKLLQECVNEALRLQKILVHKYQSNL